MGGRSHSKQTAADTPPTHPSPIGPADTARGQTSHFFLDQGWCWYSELRKTFCISEKFTQEINVLNISKDTPASLPSLRYYSYSGPPGVAESPDSSVSKCRNGSVSVSDEAAVCGRSQVACDAVDNRELQLFVLGGHFFRDTPKSSAAAPQPVWMKSTGGGVN